MDGAAIAKWGGSEVVEGLKGEFDLPVIEYTPYAIFSNQVPLFDINFFDPSTMSKEEYIEKVKSEKEINDLKDLAGWALLYEAMGEEEFNEMLAAGFNESSARILQKTVASWYKNFRLIAIVGLLSILVYIGIRIMLSSVAADKAKYKEMLKDWIVAMCLLFVMHYIMVFIVEVCETLAEKLSEVCSDYTIIELPEDTQVYSEDDEEWYNLFDKESDDAGNYLISYMGAIRFYAGATDGSSLQQIQFIIFYIVLIIYVCIFSVMYIKRVLYMAFLTMIAPLVAMTYPLDKINDGKAQGFNIWLKEYIFNALIQPVHLILYVMLMGTVMNLAVDHPFYAMIALGFMIPAEKFIRKMFGFDKASTPAGMGAMGMAGAGLLMSGVNKLVHKQKRGEREKENSNESGASKKIKFRTLDYNPISENDGEENLLLKGKTGPTAGKNNAEIIFGKEKDDAYETSVDTMSIMKNQNRNNSSGIGDSDDIGIGVEKQQVRKPLISTNPLNYEPITTRPEIKDVKNSNIENTNKRKLKTRMASGFRSLGNRYVNKGKNMHPLKTARRALGYAVGAGTVGAIGLAAGISTGDLGKTLQYTAAAGHVGGSLGKGISDDFANEGMENINAFKEGFTDKDAERKKYLDSLVADYNNKEYLREKVGSKQLKDTLSAYRNYAEYGCTDVEKFYAAYQLEKNGLSREEAIYDYKLAARTGDVYRSADAEEKWKKRLEEEYFNDALIKAQYEEKAKEIEAQIEQEQVEAEEKYKKSIEAAQISKNQEEIEKINKKREENRMRYETRRQEQKRKAKQDIVEPLANRTISNIKFYYKNL